jgi:SAM-dependent methyltransferase
MNDEILAIDPERYKNNADIILAAAEMGYLTGLVLDTTYGSGAFWAKWKPSGVLWTNDLDTSTDAMFHMDFRALLHDWDDRFDSVVFDPPYKLDGTPDDRGPGEANLLYGVSAGARDYENVDAVIQLYYDGLAECHRVTKPKGYILVKVMNQVSGGKTRWAERHVGNFLEDLGCRHVTTFYLVGSRKQPSGRRQVNVRNNYSQLLVVQKGK